MIRAKLSRKENSNSHFFNMYIFPYLEVWNMTWVCDSRLISASIWPGHLRIADQDGKMRSAAIGSSHWSNTRTENAHRGAKHPAQLYIDSGAARIAVNPLLCLLWLVGWWRAGSGREWTKGWQKAEIIRRLPAYDTTCEHMMVTLAVRTQGSKLVCG